MVKYETSRKGRARAKIRGDEYIVHPHDSPTRGKSPDQWPNKSAWQTGSPRWSRNNSPEYHSSCLDRRSRSPSPKPTPTHSDYHYRMGVTQQQEHRSRSPSPSSAHSLPLQRRPGGRRLPPTPNQPSRLRFDVHSMEGINFPSQIHSPPVPQRRGVLSVMNFPRLNPSPTHLPKLQMPPLWRDRTSTYLGAQYPPLIRTERQSGSLPGRPPGFRERDTYLYPAFSHYNQHHGHDEPLSFEAAANFGRGSRQLPSPLPNGYKPGQRERMLHRDSAMLALRTGHVGVRRSDSDEDDWC
ncbi:Voltage-dependent calcium channel type A subunit alpha-1, partial [Stegodyphus mimosarum]